MSQSTPLPGDAGVPAKKPFYARWWVIAIVAVIALAGLGRALGGGGSTATTTTQPSSAPASSAATTTAAPTTETTPDTPREHQNALAKAKTYSDSMHMSSDAIRTQLTSDAEGFTDAEADYAVAHLDD